MKYKLISSIDLFSPSTISDRQPINNQSTTNQQPINNPSTTNQQWKSVESLFLDSIINSNVSFHEYRSPIPGMDLPEGPLSNLSHILLPDPTLLPNVSLVPKVTEFMLRRSRVHLGDLRRFHRVLDKLDAGVCINVAVLGGSISQGQSAGGPVWLDRFCDWINVAFPCNGTDSVVGRHAVIKKEKSASSTDFVLTHFHELFRADKRAYDVVMVEYAFNDFGHHVNQGKGPEQTAVLTEALIRALLQLDSQPMVMYTDMSWFGNKQPPFFKQTDLGPRSKILFYYQIPTVSVFRNVFLIHLYDHMMQQKEPV